MPYTAIGTEEGGSQDLVVLLDVEGQPLGVMTRAEAARRAQEAGMHLADVMLVDGATGHPVLMMKSDRLPD
jgi:hypothetical protein